MLSHCPYSTPYSTLLALPNFRRKFSFPRCNFFFLLFSYMPDFTGHLQAVSLQSLFLGIGFK